MKSFFALSSLRLVSRPSDLTHMGGEGVFTSRAATSKGVHVNIYEYIIREYGTVLGYIM